jgi:hypothetical protein
MERAAWTDERLDDLAESIRIGFGRLDQDNRDLRRELVELRAEMNEQFRELHLLLLRGGGAVIVALIGLIAAVMLRGA